MRVKIIGSGKVGSVLARALSDRGAEVSLSSARRLGRRVRIDQQVLVLAVRDPSIAPLATALADAGVVSTHSVVLHLSGVRGVEDLAPLRPLTSGVARAHPLLSFAGGPVVFERALLLLDGDARALREARAMARLLGMKPRNVPDVDRVLYHAAACLLANGTAALSHVAYELFERAGLSPAQVREAVPPLLESVVRNVRNLGLPRALTGPVRRGDHTTIQAHLRALADRVPAATELYAAIVRAELPMARVIGDAESSSLRLLERALPGAKGPRRRRGV